MAYVNKEMTAKFRETIKSEFSKKDGWKLSVSKSDSMAVVVKILEAPINFDLAGQDYAQVNHYHLESNYQGVQADVLARINTICNEGNFDHSDAMTDYFHVGWYFSLYIGSFEKPFKFVENRNWTPNFPTIEESEAQKEEKENIVSCQMNLFNSKKEITPYIEKIENFPVITEWPNFNKNNNLEDYQSQLGQKKNNEISYVNEVIFLENHEYDFFIDHLLDPQLIESLFEA